MRHPTTATCAIYQTVWTYLEETEPLTLEFLMNPVEDVKEMIFTARELSIQYFLPPIEHDGHAYFHPAILALTFPPP